LLQKRTGLVVRADSSNSAPWDPPPVSETKRKFRESYPKPISGIYDAVVQELLVQQHLIRYNRKYKYNPAAALGFVSVFDQVLEGLPAEEQAAVFKAYVEALDEDPQQYRTDSEAWEAWVKGLSGPEELKPDADGSEQQKALADLASKFEAKEAVYSKFLAIGLFRLLELSGAKDPKALEGLVKSLNLRLPSVNRDLLTYKGVLSKLGAAKELMKEVLAREKKKQEERAAAKDKDVYSDKGDQAPAPEDDALVGKLDRSMRESEEDKKKQEA
jgi:photosystem II biogenesis protein Psp29